jgi:gluconolactonase
MQTSEHSRSSERWNRRAFLAASVSAVSAGVAAAQAPAAGAPVELIPQPRDWSGATPLSYPDPDVVALSPKFRPYVLFNTPIRRHYTGTLWAEGPAWNGVGKYLVWSDVAGNVQHRWVEDDGRVTAFRNPSGNSNGNTFDYQGRQISCEHGGRRVVRYEPNGTVTTLADRFDGKRLNSPNDVVVHPDGGIWFTDPLFGINGNYEGFKAESELPTALYRIDPVNGRLTKIDGIERCNGLCFSPDYRRLYVTGGATLMVLDIDGATARNARPFPAIRIPGAAAPSGGDGLRCDTDGNLWIGTRPGVLIATPEGEAIGMIRLPEICANVTFGGEKRNRLFMTASQSLYSVYVGTQGAHIA